MCFTLLALHGMTKKNYMLEAKRESPYHKLYGSGERRGGQERVVSGGCGMAYL